MAEERVISTSDLSSPSSSISVCSSDSAGSLPYADDMMDNGSSSWEFSPGNGGPLFHMKSLRESLPSHKRGLSNFFTGKSQSFTSVADVKCVEELAKSEKKLKSSHSWESTVKSSYNSQAIRSSMLSVGSAESIKTSPKAFNGVKILG